MKKRLLFLVCMLSIASFSCAEATDVEELEVPTLLGSVKSNDGVITLHFVTRLGGTHFERNRRITIKGTVKREAEEAIDLTASQEFEIATSILGRLSNIAMADLASPSIKGVIQLDIEDFIQNSLETEDRFNVEIVSFVVN